MMERTKFNQVTKTINITGKAFMKAGAIIVRIMINENTLRQLYKEERKNTLLAPQKSKPSKEDRNIQYYPLAKQLSKIIQIKKNVKHTQPQIKQWADEIRKLVEQNGIEYARIKNLLDWYEKNIGGEYIPVVESGYSLRTKFLRLEDAVGRKKTKKFIVDPDRGKYVEGNDGALYHVRSGEKYTD